ncbi:lysosome-associated membrane glycoprotein 2 isoform X4 [Colossoma macropomum]|uniref:lysosome-associated membrane glycoprotein 2 isoform X3 n=1 Tax=Colossoma macropomum TaxID=42526 RepID=UPI001864022D|nr:lysosome-associated membrane glycoprotein 2 isoform X3 [Colossoma macropomum]XP_036424924.1 lysosome-associated membrane glycoprotein 2 isoform X4 [Colossoma macropomum]
MFRGLSLPLLFVLLSGVLHADVLLSSPPEGYTLPTSPPTMEETDAPMVTPTTPGFASTIMDSAAATELTSATTSKPSLDTTAITEDPTNHSTNATTVAPTTHQTNSTTEAPTTHSSNVTTAAPTTEPANATTVITTNTTTASVPTTPVPTTPTPPPNPLVGDYIVKADPNSSVCLKAKMGLQFRFKPETSFQTVNLDPNVTNTNGSCGSNGTDSTLTLMSDTITVHFVFSNQTNKFHLSALKFTLVNGNGSVFNTATSNLSLWEASLGSSYMCRKEQTYNLTDSLILNTFELQVQPFGVTDNKFSTAHECSVDDTSLLIPIIVGAALAGLILIVVIAYMIGRRKTYVGYQTL